MLKPEDESEAKVTREDQDKINRYSRLVNRRVELEGFLEGRKQLLQLYDDAADELILADDDDKVQYAVGDAFLVSTKDDVEATVETNKEVIAKDVRETESQIESLHTELQQLKTSLYAKFGKSINLEEQQ